MTIRKTSDSAITAMKTHGQRSAYSWITPQALKDFCNLSQCVKTSDIAQIWGIREKYTSTYRNTPIASQLAPSREQYYFLKDALPHCIYNLEPSLIDLT